MRAVAAAAVFQGCSAPSNAALKALCSELAHHIANLFTQECTDSIGQYYATVLDKEICLLPACYYTTKLIFGT
jgi:hypothetical protein